MSIDEYRRWSEGPDVEFVDGQVVERSMGGYDHSTIQTLLAAWFLRHDVDWGTRTRVELRVQVSSLRFRIPDICVLRQDEPIEQVITRAPLICIEVLSPDDSFSSMRERVADYVAMGVENIWLFDPSSREGFVCTATEWKHPTDGVFSVSGSPIFVDMAEIFAGLDHA